MSCLDPRPATQVEGIVFRLKSKFSRINTSWSGFRKLSRDLRSFITSTKFPPSVFEIRNGVSQLAVSASNLLEILHRLEGSQIASDIGYIRIKRARLLRRSSYIIIMLKIAVDLYFVRKLFRRDGRRNVSPFKKILLRIIIIGNSILKSTRYFTTYSFCF